MADAGVDRAVLVQGVGAYGFDNEYTLAASKAAPEVFANVVCTDRRADDAAATLARAARTQGARGYRWFMVHDDARLDSPRAVGRAGRVADPGGDDVPRRPAGGLRRPRCRRSRTFRLAVDHCAFADLSQGIPDELAVAGRVPERAT